MSNNIAGKVVVITGASSGLGEATARLLSGAGAAVVLGARRADRLSSLAKELTAKGGKALAVTTDVVRRDEVKKLVDTAVQSFGRIDVMINNAGLMPQALLEKLKVGEWDRMIDVNIKGVLYGIAAALPYMKAQKSGHFINVSSVAGHRVGPGTAVYAATKHAVLALSEGLRQEVKPYNIRTTVISPGAVATELPDSVTDLGAAERVQKVLCGFRHSGRHLRPRRGLCHEPAGRCRYQRNSVPADPAGDLKGPPSRQRQRKREPSSRPAAWDPCLAVFRFHAYLLAMDSIIAFAGLFAATLALSYVAETLICRN